MRSSLLGLIVVGIDMLGREYLKFKPTLTSSQACIPIRQFLRGIKNKLKNICNLIQYIHRGILYILCNATYPYDSQFYEEVSEITPSNISKSLRWKTAFELNSERKQMLDLHATAMVGPLHRFEWQALIRALSDTEPKANFYIYLGMDLVLRYYCPIVTYMY